MVSLAAMALFFCLETKEPKIQVSREASLPHMALTLQISQNLGCNLFTLLLHARCPASVKSCYALPRSRPPSFCLISPEAYLLTLFV
jgi:hypothetical protein